MNDLQHKHEVPKVTLPRNDTSDKFWSSIEPYCADLSRDDVNVCLSDENQCEKLHNCH